MKSNILHSILQFGLLFILTTSYIPGCGGSGGIVDNGFKPPIPTDPQIDPEGDDKTPEANASSDESLSRTLLFGGSFEALIPKSFSKTKALASGGERFSGEGQFLEFSKIEDHCHNAQSEITAQKLELFQCSPSEIHIKMPNYQLVGVKTNLPWQRIAPILRSLRAIEPPQSP